MSWHRKSILVWHAGVHEGGSTNLGHCRLLQGMKASSFLGHMLRICGTGQEVLHALLQSDSPESHSASQPWDTSIHCYFSLKPPHLASSFSKANNIKQFGELVKEVPSICSKGVPMLPAGRLSQRCARTADSAHQAFWEPAWSCPAQEHLLSFL